MMTIVLFVGGYFVLLGGLSVAVRPYRVRLADLADEIICDTRSDAVRKHVQDVLRTTYSVRGAPIEFFGLCMLLVLPAHRVIALAHDAYEEHREMMSEERLAEFYELYRVSVAAVNPIFGALAYASL